MGKRYKDLIGAIADIDNLRRAYLKARAGKSMSTGHLEFKEHLEANLMGLSGDMAAGKYRPGPYHTFMVHEPKVRQISALPFSDRVVQHALVNVIGPIFDRTFLPMSYACRTGKGTHAGAIEAQAMMRRMLKHGNQVYCLKMDFSKYFASIDRAVLHHEIRRKISCGATLALIEIITPPDGVGLPIGNLTSQLFANIYGHIQDRFLRHRMGVRNFIRYMDDTVIFGHSREYLSALQHIILWFIGPCMGLKFSKWSITPVERGVNFLGYRIWPTHKLLRRASVIRAKRKIRHYRKTGNAEKLAKFTASWRGHAQWADSHNLIRSLEIA